MSTLFKIRGCYHPPAKETPLPRRPPCQGDPPGRRHPPGDPPGRSTLTYSLLECILVSMSLPSATKLRRLCFYRHVSVHRGIVYLSACWDPTKSRHPPPRSRPPQGRPLGADTHPPQSRHPPPERRLLLRTVRILLEYILVVLNFVK